MIPFRDEQEALPSLYAELDAVLSDLAMASEMIFVDDASRDEGRARLLAAAGSDPRVRLLELSPHAGQSAALEAGFRAARGEIVATLDADGQNDPADLPRLLAALSDADCVGGIRTPRRDRLSKRLASRVANAVRRRVLGDSVTDIGCSLRVMRADALRRVRIFRGSHRFLPVLMEIEGARVRELPVRHRPRRHGVSKYGLRGRLAAACVDLLGVVWIRRRKSYYDVKELGRRQ